MKFILKEESPGGLDEDFWAKEVKAAADGLLTSCELVEPMMS